MEDWSYFDLGLVILSLLVDKSFALSIPEDFFKRLYGGFVHMAVLQLLLIRHTFYFKSFPT